MKLMSFIWTLTSRFVRHHSEVIMGAMASQLFSLTSVYSIVYSSADQRKHQSSASLAFVWGLHRSPVNSPHKWPVTRKMFPFDDVIMMPLKMQEGWKESIFNSYDNNVTGCHKEIIFRSMKSLRSWHHICRRSSWSTLVQVMTCRLFERQVFTWTNTDFFVN